MLIVSTKRGLNWSNTMSDSFLRSAATFTAVLVVRNVVRLTEDLASSKGA